MNSDFRSVSVCTEHSGHDFRIAALEKSDEKQWRKIDNMKNWVIAGMGSLLLECMVIIVTILSKGG